MYLPHALPCLCCSQPALSMSHPKHHHGPVGPQRCQGTPAQGRREDNRTHQLDCSPSGGLGAGIWSNCRHQPPVKPQGTTVGKCPAVRCYHSSGKHPVWPKNEKDQSKIHMHASIQRIIIYDNQDMEGTYMPIDRWMDEEDSTRTHVHTH